MQDRGEGTIQSDGRGPQGGGMTAERQGTLRFERAAELFDAYPEIAEDMDALPDPEIGTLAFLDRLVASSTPEEAITFAAHALSRRYAVWWGHECLRHLNGQLDETDRAMLAHAARWVGDPNESTRIAAQTAAMSAAAKTPGVWIALGAAWSGGSLGPPDLPVVPPSPVLSGRAVNAGVLSVLARVDQPSRARVLAGFVQMARVLAAQS